MPELTCKQRKELHRVERRLQEGKAQPGDLKRLLGFIDAENRHPAPKAPLKKA